MKVLQNKFVEEQEEIVSQEPPEPQYPREEECEHCGSTFEYDKEDVEYGIYGCGYTICPCCGKQTFLDEEGMDLTVDNLQFPKYYGHTSVENGAVDVPVDEIDKAVRDGILYLRRNKDEFSYMWQLGTVHISVYRFDDGDHHYTVIVSKDFYETEVEFENEDYANSYGFANVEVEIPRSLYAAAIDNNVDLSNVLTKALFRMFDDSVYHSAQ